MQQRGSGVIGHVSARPGIDPDPGNVAYGVSQAALIHQRRTLDVELSPQGIRVNVVVPQLIATEKNKAMFPPDVLVGAVEPEAVADVTASLVSAAAPVNGPVVPTYGW